MFLDKTKQQDIQAAALEDTLGELNAIQKLLNLFIFLNICQFLSILGLWALDRSRKRQLMTDDLQARLRSEADIEEIFDAEPEERPKSLLRSPTSHTRRFSESHSLQRRETSLSDTSNERRSIDQPLEEPEDLSEDPGEESQPLLDDDEPSTAWQSHAAADLTAGEARTKAEHLRGEFCGAASIFLILFAWVFFIITALLRLRSKDDRQP